MRDSIYMYSITTIPTLLEKPLPAAKYDYRATLPFFATFLSPRKRGR